MIWLLILRLSTSLELGSPMRVSVLARVEKQLKSFLTANPDLMEEIDHKVRVACGLVFDEDSEVGTPVATEDSAE